MNLPYPILINRYSLRTYRKYLKIYVPSYTTQKIIKSDIPILIADRSLVQWYTYGESCRCNTYNNEMLPLKWVFTMGARLDGRKESSFPVKFSHQI